MQRKNPIQIKFGKVLRKHRKARGLTQEELAELSGLHFTYIGSVERGERNVSIKAIDTLIRALGLTYREFLEDF
ncbi:MAG: helix-turn-helix transcriptional regulator [Terriglobia bacterium]|jgi:transcriptional regulator with XRE-family HTH domain